MGTSDLDEGCIDQCRRTQFAFLFRWSQRTGRHKNREPDFVACDHAVKSSTEGRPGGVRHRTISDKSRSFVA